MAYVIRIPPVVAPAAPACAECFTSEPTVAHGSAGVTNSGGTNSFATTHHRYTEATNTWDTRTYHGSNLWLAAGAQFNGSGYQTGGGSNLADSTAGSTLHNEFSFGGNSWTARANSLANQCRHQCASTNDGIYYYTRGGLNGTTTGRHYYFAFSTGLSWSDRSAGSTTSQDYDPNGFTAIGDGSRFLFYVAASFTTVSSEGRRLFRYDSTTPGVLERASAPLPNRRQARCFWSQGCGVNIDKANCIAGLSSGAEIADNDEYDEPGNSWTSKTNKTTAIRLGAAHRINGDIYYMGGFIVAPTYSVATTERYTPGTDSWAARASMTISAHWRAQFGI